MKKIVLGFVACLIFTVAAHAQAQSKTGSFNFGAGINLAVPTGTFGTAWSFGIGAQAQGEYMFSDNLSGVASVGYTDFLGKTQNIGGFQFKTPSVGLIPLLVGARFYPSEQFFVGAQIGFGILSGSGSSTSGFDYYPQVGYVTGPLQFILGYNGLSVTGGTYNHIGLTALYQFGGGQ